MKNEKNIIEDKMTAFFVISMFILNVWSGLGIILALGIYFSPGNDVSLIIKFLSNLVVILIPSIISILLGIFIFKKQYKLKYISISLIIPFIIALCEHVVFMYIG
ncbi:MAG: hypothetical protein IJH34_08915 [Romboutsia sp.]|nr:hypothetical protein [Romboutsia sp.]